MRAILIILTGAWRREPLIYYRKTLVCRKFVWLDGHDGMTCVLQQICIFDENIFSAYL